MASKLKFPIRYKILAVLGTVVIAAIGLYLYLASRLFYSDKTLLIYELNQSNVRQLSMDIEITVSRTVDKLRLISAMLVAEKPGTGHASKLLAQLTESEDMLAGLRVFRARAQNDPNLVSTPEGVSDLPAGKSVDLIFSRQWPKYLEAYGKTTGYLGTIRQQLPIPLGKITKLGLWIRSAVPAGANPIATPPLITVATSTDVERGDEKWQLILAAEVRSDKLIDAFTHAGVARAYAADSEGFSLVQANETLASVDLRSDPIVRKGLDSKVRSEVVQFEEGPRQFLGAFYQTGLASVIVASKAEVGEAFAAARILIKKSILYAAIVITAAFLIVLFLAHTLTEPIREMAEATHKVAAGDFAAEVPVKTHDELAELARSFNRMTIDLKDSRAKIEEYNRELENKVTERTARLEQQNIAIKEAQEALLRTTRLASVGEIAGRAAHEVLNPLTSIVARLEKIRTHGLAAENGEIQLMAEIARAWHTEFAKGGARALIKALLVPSAVYAGKTMLEEDLENMNRILGSLDNRKTERGDDIDFLLKEADRISKIVNSMRQLTRVSGNHKPIDIKRVIEETVATMRDMLHKRRIAIETSFSGSIPEVVSDHDELLQVFSNLIRNSVQAIEEGLEKSLPVGPDPKIWINTAAAVLEGRKWVFVRVCDNGPGIPADKFGVVFEASYTTKAPSEGTGLGLSISRRFIRASEGEIMVEKSIPGVETAFLIQLPEVRPEAKIDGTERKQS